MKIKVFFLPLSIILSLVIVIWMAKPQYDQLQTVKVSLRAEQDKLANIDSQINMLNSALAQYQTVAADEPLILNALPDDKNYDDAIAEIYQKVKQSNVLLKDMTLGQGSPVCPLSAANSAALSGAAPVSDISNKAATAAPASGTQPAGSNDCLQVYEYNLSVSGDYLPIKDFVKELVKLNRYSEIAKISLSRADLESGSTTDNSSGAISARISLNTFSKPKNQSSDINTLLISPVGQILLSGKLETDIIEKYKESITSRSFEEIPVGNYGKPDLFSPSVAIPVTTTTTTTTTN